MSKTWRQQMKRWMTKTMELPADVLMDLPRITLVGQIHIYIENHKGLLAFSDTEIRVLLKQGQMLVRGEGLVIKVILPEELVLEGKINQVLYLEQ
ncbi:sporulation protein YqfC [Priestia flexa]|jgi:sporulation protein YqfC|uniref:Sporulation protein YqfC n=2 Tax=Priestia TaxID=2800373 RepID=A0A0V8JJ63_9BACI|nr:MULTISPECIES: sporulation protein YqfC [Bacillaceae]OZT13516.1 sporulation protein YqfC [Priestia aryabhattai]USY54519.1 sporulation protein YqfC [Bacillus sp. 1780r2a1]AQX53702.1 sporulation protein YqfC [Priestia flexa]KSU87092.1 sporulation protein YqfC [Priestia veravalensis]KZB93065.1 sporulation protein YqfC [Bacillus sp. VT 712]